MNVSVIICTWNRAALLDQTLTEMRKLKIPPGVEWELLVVNNNCTDDTDAVIARHAQHLPIRRLLERTLGKSFAANLAISEAKGDLLLWTDDDVLVDPEWLSEYVKVVRERPDVMYFGGQVEPWFAVKPPKWIAANLPQFTCVYAIRQIGSAMRPIGESEFPYGVNMAVRKQAFHGISFDTRIGPNGTTQIRGEEVELIKHFKQLAYRGLWVPGARLRHYIPRERLTTAYVWSFHVGASRTVARLQGRQEGKLWFGAPRWAIKEYLLHSLKAFLLSPLKGRQWMRAFERAAWAKGIIIETRAQSQDAATGIPATIAKPQEGFSPLGGMAAAKQMSSRVEAECREA